MAHTFEELKAMNVDQLREVAAEIDDESLKGYTQMHKEHLLEAICKSLNIDMHAHHEVVGIDKAAIKNKIKDLKKKRDEALAAHDGKALKKYRREIHALKRTLRRATV